MNKKLVFTLLAATGLLAPANFGQEFSSGSDGSFGPLEVTENTTVPLPPDGILHCSTVTVAPGATLRFEKNALNTPVHILATGDVVIRGTIDVGGFDAPANSPDGGPGGPGGFDGAKPGFSTVPPGVGFGPGGGRPGADSGSSDGAGGGSFGSVPTSGSSTNRGGRYGSPLLIPMIGGSGGGGIPGSPGKGGGGGGGAILIASNTRIELAGGATINARGGGRRESGGVAYYNPGSGGAVRLVAPIVAGSGTIDVRGGNHSYGGNGRIRVDSIDRRQLLLDFNPSSATSVGSTLLVFPDPMPRLDLIQVAGTQIAEGHPSPVQIHLPFGSDPNRTVTVQARDFNAVVPVRVVLAPDNGPIRTYDTEIDNTSSNPAQAVVNVEFPVNVQVTVFAWTR